MVLLVDDEDRENEGDLVVAAEHATAGAVNFMARHGRGLICLALPGDQVDRLGLPPMTARNQSPRQTAFTVSVEARTGVTTGISAFDRARTIQVACDPASGPEDLVSPGHVFPLRAVEGGVLARAGHTEGSVELVRRAGLRPAAVICEVMNDDGTMARRAELEAFARTHDVPIVTVREVVEACRVEIVARAKLPSAFGVAGAFEVVAFRGGEHLAVIAGQPGTDALVRLHSECLTGDALGSLRCDCGEQLREALQRISESPNGGVLLYLRQEGRGIGLKNKIRAYALQDKGLDTVEANQHLGLEPDPRSYGEAARMLLALGLTRVRLLTNNPRKVQGLKTHGVEVVERVPLEVAASQHNMTYLRTKREKLGHELGGQV